MKKLIAILFLVVPFFVIGQSLYKKDFSSYRLYVGELVVNNQKFRLTTSDSSQILQYNGLIWANIDSPYSLDSIWISNENRCIVSFGSGNYKDSTNKIIYNNTNANLSTVKWAVADATEEYYAPSWGQSKQDISDSLYNISQLRFIGMPLLPIPETGMIEFSNDKFYITNVNYQRAIDRTDGVALVDTTVLDTTIETTIYTGKLPANSLRAGNILLLRVSGVMSNSSTADQVTINVYVGSTLNATITSEAKNISVKPWTLDGFATIRTIGVNGILAYHMTMTIDGDDVDIAGTGTLNTTTQDNITVKVKWNNAKTGNTITLQQGFLSFKN